MVLLPANSLRYPSLLAQLVFVRALVEDFPDALDLHQAEVVRLELLEELPDAQDLSGAEVRSQLSVVLDVEVLVERVLGARVLSSHSTR